MINIGIVGAENSHTAAIAKTLNVQKMVEGFRVVCVWGETDEFARNAADAGQIPTIVKEPEEMIGKVDAAIVDHRHGKYHLPAVQPLLEAKLPLFVDKPFCYRVAEGVEFLSRARELEVPVCSFSVLPKQSAFEAAQKEVAELGALQGLVSTGPCDIHSEYGGVFFYGIHQVDMVLRLLGYDVTHAQMNVGQGDNHTAMLFYASGAIATMNLLGGGRPAFHLSVVGENGRMDRTIGMDENAYLSGVQSFTYMFATGRTDETEETMLMPVAVLEALEASLETGEKVEVARA